MKKLIYTLGQKKLAHFVLIWAGLVLGGCLGSGPQKGPISITLTNGITLSGNLVSNGLVSDAEMRFPDGKTFRGEVRRVQYSDFNRYIPSRGTMTWDLGQTFTGTFRADGQLFYGKMIYVSGDTYEGPFENNKRSGNGTYTWKNGERATGTFIDGKMDGQFVRTKADGFSQKETWRMGKFMSDRALANEAEEKRFAAEKRAAELADAKKRALEAQKFRERIELIENHRKNKIEECLYAEVKI